ncbi:MAG: T9SS type A sorting domain-containing protein, partial [Psychroflexus sp.]|nr:T9SS type A sorting domain-containing protein [Psychroflexus sp.]
EGEFLLEQLSSVASRDCFIIKLDSNSQFLWAKQISNPSGGAANEDSKAIEVDSNGNIYVAGSFIFADFDPDPVDTEEILTQNATNGNDGFLVKLDTNGDFQWVKVFEAGGNASVEDIVLDENEDILLTGSYENSIDLNPSDTTADEFFSNGSKDIFVAKLDNMGNYVWGNSFGGPDSDLIDVIKNMPSGIYIGGTISGTVDLDPGSGTDVISTNGVKDGFFSKFDSTGTYQYGYTIGGADDASATERVYDITQVNDGNLIIIGTFTGTTDFDLSSSVANTVSNGGADNYILKIMPDGSYIEHVTIGGVNNEGSPQVLENSAGDYLSIGTFSSPSVDFNPFNGDDTQNNSSNTTSDIYVSRFNTSQTMRVNEENYEYLDLFPNPASRYIEISGTNDLETYEIYSITGQLVKSGEYLDRIQVYELETGLYFIKLGSGTISTTKKFIKK